jgi:predicted component of type VI protein secretion system
MRKKLIISDGTRDRELQLVGRIVVGRDPSCDVSHDDSLLSRRHAEFFTAGDVVTVKDLGSRNGVFVNGARAAEQRLAAGDVVQIGPLRARYLVDKGPATIAPEEMDGERTAIFRSPIIPPAVPETSESVGTPAVISGVPAFSFDSVEGFDSEEEEVTRLVPAPRMPKPAPAAPATAAGTAAVAAPPGPAASSSAVLDDDDVTHFSKAPRFTIPVVAPLPAAPVPPPEPRQQEPTPFVRTQQTSAAAPDLGGFVFGQVLTLALMILLASLVPSLIGSGSVGWYLIPLIVATLGSYFIGGSINRRLTRALEAVERKGS